MDPSGLYTTSSVTVTVAQTLTSLSVTPGTVSLANLTTQQFTAAALDQFANAMASQPSFTWQVNGGGSTISSTGLFTANGVGNVQVKVSVGILNAQANISVTVPPAVPVVTSPAGTNRLLSRETTLDCKSRRPMPMESIPLIHGQLLASRAVHQRRLSTIPTITIPM